MRLDRADSWHHYLESWSRRMRDTYWFRERRLFDYSREETEALHEEFEKGDNIFPIALVDGGEMLGTLGIGIQARA